MTNCSTSPSFADIKAILDSLVEGLDMEHLKQVHHSPDFGWDTPEQLGRVVVRPSSEPEPSYRLIDPELVAAKKGAETNLIKALSDPTGGGWLGRMPRKPPALRYATPEQIAMIVAWINAGMPLGDTPV